MDTSIFEQITSALTVKSLCSPMGPDVPSDSTSADLDLMYSGIYHPLDCPSRVVGANGDVVGIVWSTDYFNARASAEENEAFAEKVMDRLTPRQLLSSGTSILEMVELFGKTDDFYFYVIEVNKVIGVIFYRDIFKPIGRLAFLALALEIEDRALRLCQTAAVRVRCWASISDNRRSKAIELFRFRYDREPNLNEYSANNTANIFDDELSHASDISRLIGCTQLVDKATMIWKQRLIATAKQADILGFFNELREIRDQCAHPGGDVTLIPRKRLAHFVSSARRMRTSLDDAMQTHGVNLGNDWDPL